jgi:NAD(P)-dependent dehydrogenase (short-subunit alcohol dehydrogenase family)
MKTWLITGCSTGLGRSLAKAVLQKGDNVVVTARDTKKLEEFEKDFPRTALIVRLDVTDLPSVTEAVRAAKERFGGIDVLVNNAGYGYRAAVEEGNPEDTNRLFATNFWGPVNLIKAVLPDMRARKSGAVINVSSIAALRTAPGSGYYAASKRALEGMTEGLYLETAPLGIKVMIVEPGAFRTDFAGRSLTQSKTAIADYAGTAGTRRIENDKTHGAQPGDPDKGARLIIEAIEAEDAPLRLLLGSDAVRAADTVLESHKSEYDKWREFSRRSDF